MSAADKALKKARRYAWVKAHPVKSQEAAKNFRNKHRTRLNKKASIRHNRNKTTLNKKTQLRLYGLSEADYDLILLRQNGLCAICKEQELNGKALCIDHCHATGRIRGMLCRRCNAGLGYFRDNPQKLQAAISYLSDAADSVDEQKILRYQMALTS